MADAPQWQGRRGVGSPGRGHGHHGERRRARERENPQERSRNGGERHRVPARRLDGGQRGRGEEQRGRCLRVEERRRDGCQGIQRVHARRRERRLASDEPIPDEKGERHAGRRQDRLRDPEPEHRVGGRKPQQGEQHRVARYPLVRGIETPAMQEPSRRVHVQRLVREVEAAAQRHRDHQAYEETEEEDARESFAICAQRELMPGPPG